MQFGKSDGINRHYVSLRPFDMSMEVILKIHQVIHLNHSVTKRFSGVSNQQPQVLQVTFQVLSVEKYFHNTKLV